jgi:hypothetical protein
MQTLTTIIQSPLQKHYTPLPRDHAAGGGLHPDVQTQIHLARHDEQSPEIRFNGFPGFDDGIGGRLAASFGPVPFSRV